MFAGPVGQIPAAHDDEGGDRDAGEGGGGEGGSGARGNGDVTAKQV